MSDVVFTVYGKAEPQGSARAFMPRKGGRFPTVTSDNPKLKGWRKDVARACPRPRELMKGPVRLMVAFYLPRPKALRARPTPHTKKPDVDKLARGICDALTQVVWEDDSQVAQMKVTKEYAGVGESPRAVIVVTPLQPEGMLPL